MLISSYFISLSLKDFFFFQFIRFFIGLSYSKEYTLFLIANFSFSTHKWRWFLLLSLLFSVIKWFTKMLLMRLIVFFKRSIVIGSEFARFKRILFDTLRFTLNTAFILLRIRFWLFFLFFVTKEGRFLTLALVFVVFKFWETIVTTERNKLLEFADDSDDHDLCYKLILW